ncbi:hypothetical protein GCM10027030_01950 [Luteococcus sediminum]
MACAAVLVAAWFTPNPGDARSMPFLAVPTTATLPGGGGDSPLPVRITRGRGQDADVAHGGKVLAACVGLLVSVAYSWLATRIHARLGTGMDLAIFDQGVRTLALGTWPTSSMKAVAMNLWGDHLHPIILGAVPAYWVRPDPTTLLVLQAACLGLACAILVHTACRLLPGQRLLPVALGLSLAGAPGVQSGMTFDVHEVGFGLPVLALALSALLLERWRPFMLWSLALLLTKEDAGLLVLGLALVAVVKGARRQAVVLMVAATSWTWFAVQVVIPRFSPSGSWLYADKVQDTGQSLRSIVLSM